MFPLDFDEEHGTADNSEPEIRFPKCRNLYKDELQEMQKMLKYWLGHIESLTFLIMHLDSDIKKQNP
ncbi:MAG: hypothetical protein ACLRVB_02510 [Blautia sp.]